MSNAFYEKYRQKLADPKPNLLVTSATNASPIVITTDRDHGLATADSIAIINVAGNTAANGLWDITVTGSDTFSLDTSSGSGVYTADTGEVLLPDSLLKKMTHIVRWGDGTSGGGNRDYADDIKAVLVDTGAYTVNLNTDEFLSDIDAGAQIATSSNFSSKTAYTGSGGTLVGGVLDAADLTFSAVGPSGTTIEALVIYKDTGTAATSPLIAYINVATGLPVTANGGDINVTWSSGSNRIAKI